MLSHLLLQLSVMFLAVTGGLHVRCCATCCSTDETLFQAVFSIHMQGLMGIQRVVVNLSLQVHSVAMNALLSEQFWGVKFGPFPCCVQKRWLGLSLLFHTT